MCKIGTFQRNLTTMFLKILNIYLVLKIFQKVRIEVRSRKKLMHFLLKNYLKQIWYQVLNSRPHPHSTEIFTKYCRRITWKYCKSAKIFRNLSLISLKYCNNFTMSAQNMTYVISSKYCQN